MSRLQRARRSIGPALAIGLAAATLSGVVSTPAQATDWSRQCVRGPPTAGGLRPRRGHQRRTAGRCCSASPSWSRAGTTTPAAPSTSAGYGPMHLTSPDGSSAARRARAWARATARAAVRSEHRRTRERIGKARSAPWPRPPRSPASRRRGCSPTRSPTSAAARPCWPTTSARPAERGPGDWCGAVARYSGADDQADRAAVRARGLRHHPHRRGPHHRRRPAGHACAPTRRPASTRGRCGPRACRGRAARPGRLPARPGLRVDPGAVRAVRHDPGRLRQPRPRRTGRTPGKIDYIVIHDTEGDLGRRTLKLVQDPTYVSLALHAALVRRAHRPARATKDVAWHAGNWYVNMHSIGIEHEGFAAQGAHLVHRGDVPRLGRRWCATWPHKYDIPLDRRTSSATTRSRAPRPAPSRGMHWDPGPYWDWEHYFELLGAPLTADRRAGSRPSSPSARLRRQPQPVDRLRRPPARRLPAAGHQLRLPAQPARPGAPLVNDIGLQPDGAPSTTSVSDIGARAAAGQQFAVAERQGDWTAIWYLGAEGLVPQPAGDPTLAVAAARSSRRPAPRRSRSTGAPTRRPSAYPARIPYQAVAPLQYSFPPGQRYVLG